MSTKNEVVFLAEQIAKKIAGIPLDERIEVLNEVRSVLHQAGPFGDHPVDNVQWVKSERLRANDYNPNRVAPPEMKLLRLSIKEDGLTQPIVGYPEAEDFEVVDGFHRNTICSTDAEVKAKTHGYTPVVPLSKDKSTRMASTIRHNRARGTHSIELMVNIVGELKAAGMSDAWILRHIGMDADELLRLKQLSGLAELFKDREFSETKEI
jgi:ParB-like chromosome segregation protein Spo0J